MIKKVTLRPYAPDEPHELVLPEEVLLAILRLSGPSTLANIARCSKTYRDAVTPVLYRKLEFCSEALVKAFFERLDFPDVDLSVLKERFGYVKRCTQVVILSDYLTCV